MALHFRFFTENIARAIIPPRNPSTETKKETLVAIPSPVPALAAIIVDTNHIPNKLKIKEMIKQEKQNLIRYVCFGLLKSFSNRVAINRREPVSKVVRC
jgi:hypothetical protein